MTVHLQRLLDRLATGEEAAREELITCAWDRLEVLARKMIRDFPNVRRWEQTDDVVQQAALRVWRSLEKVEFNDARHFLRIVARQIRFVLIDLARHYYGPHGLGKHHASQRELPSSEPLVAAAGEAPSQLNPRRAAQWVEIHSRIDQLPNQEREIFDLLWYHGLTQEEAANLVGVDVRTVKRRWRKARLILQESLADEISGH